MTKPALLALDWGTTSLRVYILDTQGAILAATSQSDGILNIPDGDFAVYFERLITPICERYGSLPAIAAGMIGSRQGWQETAYLACPVALDTLAGQLTPLPTGTAGVTTLWLLPGVSYEDPAGVPDVMRGEETQIIGALAGSATADERQLYILPGTHSKWALVETKQLIRFATFMSGELFALLCQHSILGRLMTANTRSRSGFLRGLEYAATADPQQGGLLKRLFSARTLGLFDRIDSDDLQAYLSGLIIGSEISEALAMLGAGEPLPIRIIGSPELSAFYQLALQQRGLDCSVKAPDTVAAGLFTLARTAGLINDD